MNFGKLPWATKPEEETAVARYRRKLPEVSSQGYNFFENWDISTGKTKITIQRRVAMPFNLNVRLSRKIFGIWLGSDPMFAEQVYERGFNDRTERECWFYFLVPYKSLKNPQWVLIDTYGAGGPKQLCWEVELTTEANKILKFT